ncbi:MAG: nucleotidyltransferase [Acidimicrobiia bacterium]|nr:nucleotidyltransferase substrate binding protein [bacterium]MXX64336.1 nucleotidyltransferase [Acidimicrobiia bacterium]MCY3580228.1 nucleotidyltransferase substrate binding protein [bacterium]MCY3651769.1 nucleotidyltransferase substrate binding protein [bacterium]MDE0643507.1 nucleotidyltransferase substrate binding protein [bacterium]
MKLNTDYLTRSINALESAYNHLSRQTPDEEVADLSGIVLYDIFRAACVKEFEIILEQCGSILRKRLRPYMASNRQADRLTFNNTFRRSAKHGLITVEACERWLGYREIRNDTAHHYGANYAEAALGVLSGFIEDAKHIVEVLATPFDE